MKRFLILALAFVAFTASTAGAQGINYDKTGTKLFGGVSIPMNVPNVYCTVWNTTDSTITDGSVVVVDTTASIKRIGVRNYIPGTTSRFRCLGLAYGDIKRSSSGTPGRVLITGFHPNAFMAASNLSAFNTLKVSLSVNGSLAVSDTVSGVVGLVVGGNAGTRTGVRYTNWVYIFRPLSTVAGATL